MALDLLLVGLGLLALLGGGELLVRGAGQLSLALGISPQVVGLTVVAIGTSTPELVVSLDAAMRGAPEVAVGNVVGSNIFNVLLILGVAALIRPCVIRGRVVKAEWPVLALASLALVVVARDNEVSRVEGALFVLGLGVFLAATVALASRVTPAVQEQLEATTPAVPEGWVRPLLYAIAGIGLLVLGARALVSGATELAHHAGVPDRVVALSVVAIGTSLPELFASAVASWRGQDDIAVANVVGSNIFNLLGILGITALVIPLPVSEAMQGVHLWWMVGSSLVLLPLMWPSMRLQRWKGALLLAGTAAYVAVLATGG